ncbi:hypothetical protein Cob_v006554 [Colletotrichum orbiculare MAFF 240422]|uniref:Uncharacterized protein n=1 Tax=Colletotrichum orbiculare (strain 104-T / ATCC 96160 / CBS 514.97 / LARS 414 / MAFF 240422) TaxID=1213857 RepID=A0A484FR28_COLOR|nr:hypothetical protein Cob_v006554 [Colletotrichum orbiculare MAFF 240422]
MRLGGLWQAARRHFRHITPSKLALGHGFNLSSPLELAALNPLESTIEETKRQHCQELPPDAKFWLGFTLDRSVAI